MARFFRLVAVVLLMSPAAVSAAALDDYYLSKFGERAQLARSLRAVVGLDAEPAERCRTHLYRSLKRDFPQLEPETQKVLAKYVGRPVLAGAASFASPGGHFTIHYATTGGDAPVLTSNDGDAIPDWVERVADVFEQVYAAEVTILGFRAPAVARYDVYLRDLVPEAAYGFTSNDGFPASGSVSVGSYIEIDKAFTHPIFTDNGTYTSDQLLQITAAHEFHHAIQFGYNYYFDIWYGEATATWIEDEVYESVNQLYSYLPRYLSQTRTISIDAAGGNSTEYGRWIFNRYLAENRSGVVRAAWERLGTLHPSSSPTTATGDIQMVPVLNSVLSGSYSSSFSTDFFGFAKRVYTRNWSTHVADTNRIPSHTVTASYTTYPVSSSSVPTPSVILPRYSFAFYRFVPTPAVATLGIAVSKTSGIQTALFRKSGGAIDEIAASAGGASYSVPGFGSLNPSSEEVVLLIANTTNVESHQASFSTDGTPAVVQEPSVAPAGGGGGGGGGCFIATAAYGSYLHPEVARLREFRDRHLLTNAPGRLFVSLYYRLSSPVAEVIAGQEWMRGGVRLLLVPLVLAVKYPAGALALLLFACGFAARRVARRHRLFA